MSKTQVTYENLTRAQERSYNLIVGLGIYELRSIARVFGDNSPTTSKRNDHIKFIMDKIISGEDLQPIPIRQGRPYKILSNVESILEELSAINGKDYTLKSLTNKQNDNVRAIGFRQVEIDIVKQKLFPIKVRGVVINHSVNNFYLTSENIDVLIEKKTFPNLEQFDYVEGTAVVMNENNEYILDEVERVNFTDIEKYSSKIISQELVLPSKKISLSSKEAILGQRYLIGESKLTDNLETLKKMVSEFKKNNIVTMALVANTMFDDYLLLQKAQFDNLCVLKFDDKPADYSKKINIFINQVKRLNEIGKSVAVFVQDIVTIIHILDSYYDGSAKTYFNHTEETASLVKDIIMLAKATSSMTTTLFVTNDATDNNDLLYMTFVNKVSHKF